MYDLTELTKEQTEFFIETFELAEYNVADFNSYQQIFWCNVVDGCIEYSKTAPIKNYIRSWFKFEFDSVFNLAAPYYKFGLPVSTDRNAVNFAKLIWLDFMLFELYDHLNSFES